MTVAPDIRQDSARLGFVVIGRNEGERLRQCLASLGDQAGAPVMYSDSGSTDGSVELARSMGATVHELDPDTPFTAARARQEAVEILLEQWPSIQWIQFVDGDCTLEPEWTRHAVEALESDRHLAIVCGMLRELSPNASIYNRMCDLQWRVPAGEVEACGGIFMIRRTVYEEVGGFNPVLLTREERDLCARVLHRGSRIVRLDAPMAKHDAGLLRFSQWWNRAVWGGHGAAIATNAKRGSLSASDVPRIGRYLMWPVGVPLLALAGLTAMLWSIWLAIVPLFCVLMYAILFARIGWWRLQNGDSPTDAALYAVLTIVRKFATGYGFMRYVILSDGRASRPDPHAAPHGKVVVGTVRHSTGPTTAVDTRV